MLSKVEIDILKHLYQEKLIDPMNSRTIKRISQQIGLNYFRVRSNVNKLMLLKLIKMGYRERSSNTFYISQEGINEIKEV